MAAEKRYTNGIFIKSVQTKYGSLLNVSISDLALKELQENSKKGYANITVAERKEADKYGNTHYAFYNDYTKEAKQELPSGRNYTQPEPETNDDLPF